MLAKGKKNGWQIVGNIRKQLRRFRDGVKKNKKNGIFQIGSDPPLFEKKNKKKVSKHFKSLI